jgi:hypothetical protein
MERGLISFCATALLHSVSRLKQRTKSEPVSCLQQQRRWLIFKRSSWLCGRMQLDEIVLLLFSVASIEGV